MFEQRSPNRRHSSLLETTLSSYSYIGVKSGYRDDFQYGINRHCRLSIRSYSLLPSYSPIFFCFLLSPTIIFPDPPPNGPKWRNKFNYEAYSSLVLNKALACSTLAERLPHNAREPLVEGHMLWQQYICCWWVAAKRLEVAKGAAGTNMLVVGAAGGSPT